MPRCEKATGNNHQRLSLVTNPLEKSKVQSILWTGHNQPCRMPASGPRSLLLLSRGVSSTNLRLPVRRSRCVHIVDGVQEVAAANTCEHCVFWLWTACVTVHMSQREPARDTCQYLLLAWTTLDRDDRPNSISSIFVSSAAISPQLTANLRSQLSRF